MEEESDIIYDDEDTTTVAERNLWDRQAVLFLIKHYKQYRSKFSDPDVRKRVYWEIVCNKLADQGYNFDVEQCEKKWRNLKKTFKDNEGKQVVSWCYYDALKDIFSSEAHSTKQKMTVDSDKHSNSFLDVEMDFGEDSNLENNSDEESSPPSWFLTFLNEYREDEKKRMKKLEDMHKEIVQLEKLKCALLKKLVEKL